MQALAPAGIGLLIGASVLVAIRLLVLHRRTGGAPELMLASLLAGSKLGMAENPNGGHRFVAEAEFVLAGHVPPIER